MHSTTFDKSQHPTGDGHRFINREYGYPEVGLAYPDLPVYDPTFFHDRIASGASGLREVRPDTLPQLQQAAVRNATQAVNDAWVLEHGITAQHVGAAGDWVETKVYHDGAFLIADIQHKNQDEGVSGSLIAFNAEGGTVGQFDNINDDFGGRWVPASGLRAQLLTDMAESSRDGSLGDQL